MCTQPFLQVMTFRSLLCLKTAHLSCRPILYLNQTGSQVTKQRQSLANQCFTATIKPYAYKWNVTLKTKSQFLQAALIHRNCYRRQPHSFRHFIRVHGTQVRAMILNYHRPWRPRLLHFPALSQQLLRPLVWMSFWSFSICVAFRPLKSSHRMWLVLQGKVKELRLCLLGVEDN